MTNLPIRFADHPGGHKIEFHPEPHHYLLNGEKLDSVTSRIHKWFPQFDAQAVAQRKGEREGVEPSVLLALWERKRDEAAKFGSKVHSMAETILREGDERAADDMPLDDRERRYLATIKAVIARVTPSYEFIETEKIVFSPAAKVAGTVDILLKSKLTDEWIVGDWKTNREIKYQSYQEEKGFGPCNALENCNFIHYSLQTAAYGELLANEAYLPGQPSVRGVLFHLNETKGHVTCDFIKVKDLRLEAKAILNPNSLGTAK